MNHNGYQGEKEPTPEMEPIRQRQRFLGAAYRALILFGLITLAIGAVLVIFTSFFPSWSLAFPMVFLVVGIILARFEYALHKRLNRK